MRGDANGTENCVKPYVLSVAGQPCPTHREAIGSMHVAHGASASCISKRLLLFPDFAFVGMTHFGRY